jgi:NADP-dependent 3-hydroxy acid dehydrogenase YdfG
MSRVSGKVAIITGAASGLGYASAIKLMSEGAKVMILAKLSFQHSYMMLQMKTPGLILLKKQKLNLVR